MPGTDRKSRVSLIARTSAIAAFASVMLLGSEIFGASAGPMGGFGASAEPAGPDLTLEEERDVIARGWR